MERMISWLSGSVEEEDSNKPDLSLAFVASDHPY